MGGGGAYSHDSGMVRYMQHRIRRQVLLPKMDDLWSTQILKMWVICQRCENITPIL